MIRNQDLSTVEPFDPDKVTEYVTHSWYDYDGGDEQGLHPFDGETSPNYTGPQPPFDRLDTDGKYSWLKSPRYDGLSMEVGPLSRMLVAYGSGHPRVQELVGFALGQARRSVRRRCSPPWGASPLAASRRLSWPRNWTGWLDELADNMGQGELAYPRQFEVGSQLPGRQSAPEPASTRLRVELWDIGCAYPQGRDRQLPVRGTQHLECRTAGRHGPARALRAGSDRQPGA